MPFTIPPRLRRTALGLMIAGFALPHCSKERPKLSSDVRVQAHRDTVVETIATLDAPALPQKGDQRTNPIVFVYGERTTIRPKAARASSTWIQLPLRQAATAAKLTVNGPPNARWEVALFVNADDTEPTEVYGQEIPGHPIVITGLAIGPKFGAPLLRIRPLWVQDKGQEVYGRLHVIANRRGKGQEIEPFNGGPDHAVLLHPTVGAGGVLSHNHDRDCVRMDPPAGGCWAAQVSMHRLGRRQVKMQTYDSFGKMVAPYHPTSHLRDDVINIATDRTKGFCLSTAKLGKVGIEWKAKWARVDCDPSKRPAGETWLAQPEVRLVPTTIREHENRVLHRSVDPATGRDRIMLEAAEYHTLVQVEGPVTQKWEPVFDIPGLMGPGRHSTLTATAKKRGSQPVRYTIRSQVLNKLPFQRPGATPMEISSAGITSFVHGKKLLSILLPMDNEARARWTVSQLIWGNPTAVQLRVLDSEGRAVTIRTLDSGPPLTLPLPPEYGPYKMELKNLVEGEPLNWISVTPTPEEPAPTPTSGDATP